MSVCIWQEETWLSDSSWLTAESASPPLSNHVITWAVRPPAVSAGFRTCTPLWWTTSICDSDPWKAQATQWRWSVTQSRMKTWLKSDSLSWLCWGEAEAGMFHPQTCQPSRPSTTCQCPDRSTKRNEIAVWAVWFCPGWGLSEWSLHVLLCTCGFSPGPPASSCSSKTCTSGGLQLAFSVLYSSVYVAMSWTGDLSRMYPILTYVRWDWPQPRLTAIGRWCWMHGGESLWEAQ